MDITNFSGEYEFLSNFYVTPVKYKWSYGNAEAAYQAQKAANPDDANDFMHYSPVKAKYRGRKLNLRNDWEEVKLAVMRDVVWAKFFQHPELAERLLATRDATLIEGNTWHDTFWSVDIKTGEGQNNLGKILMEIREELKNPEAALLKRSNATITRFSAPEVETHPLIPSSTAFDLKPFGNDRIRLHFERAYKIDNADARSFDGIKNFTWYFRGKTFTDLSFTSIKSTEILSKKDSITQGFAVLAEYTKVFYQQIDVPTFDSFDREWDGMDKFVMFRDAGGVHMIQSRHGWKIPAITIYAVLKTVDPAFEKFLAHLD